MDASLPRPLVRALRTLLLVCALASPWWVSRAQALPAQAALQDQSGLSFEWISGEPPRFMCLGDSVDLLFAMHFTPNPELAALSPLSPPGQPTPVPPSVGGALDMKVTKGSLSKSHWKLDFRTQNYMAGSVTYRASSPGTFDLTVDYHYYDSIGSYQGSQPPVLIRVQPCDYRVQVSLTELLTIQGIAGNWQSVLTGEGGFKIKYDQKNAKGHTLFSGNGATEVDQKYMFTLGDIQAFDSSPITGQGTMAITGEILDDGTLELSLIIFDIPLSNVQSTGVVAGAGSRTLNLALGKWTTTAKCLDSMRFPAEGGTQPCSGPGPIRGGTTSTMTGQVTVSWEDAN